MPNVVTVLFILAHFQHGSRINGERGGTRLASGSEYNVKNMEVG